MIKNCSVVLEKLNLSNLKSIKLYDPKPIVKTPSVIHNQVKNQYSSSYSTNYELTNLKYLAKHTRPYVCEICLKRFGRKDSLLNHLRLCFDVSNVQMTYSECNTSPNFTCPYCQASFNTLSNFRRHERIHTHPNYCESCGSRFAQQTTLAEHKCESVSYVCTLCCGNNSNLFSDINPKMPFMSLDKLTQFPTLIQLEEHLSDQAIHSDLPAMHKCSACHKSFRLRLMLQEHLCSYNQTKISGLVNTLPDKTRNLSRSRILVDRLDPYICEVCGQKFASLNALRNHRVLHGERRFPCPICGKRFHRKDTLKEHGRVHENLIVVQDGQLVNVVNHNNSNKNILSPICEKTTSESHSYNQAKINVNPSNNYYACSLCGKIVKSKCALDNHLKLHAPVGSEKLHACSVCAKTFLQKGNLAKHMNTHVQQRYSCPVCHKVYSSKEYCMQHIRQHTDDKTFVCPACGKRYLLRYKMLDHYTRAHAPSTTTYQCPFCHLKLKMKHSLKRHLHRKHAKFASLWGKPGYIESIKAFKHDNVISQPLTYDHTIASQNFSATNFNLDIPLTGFTNEVLDLNSNINNNNNDNIFNKNHLCFLNSEPKNNQTNIISIENNVTTNPHCTQTPPFVVSSSILTNNF